MPRIFNQETIVYQEDSKAIDKFKLLTAFPRLSTLVNSKHLVFDLRILKTGEYSFPYHFHRNAEELIMILSGSLTMRTPNGFETLKTGDIIFFEVGEGGAHQFYNHEIEPCKYFDIRTTFGIDICEYPDSGKINIVPYNEVFEQDSKVDYHKGEENVDLIWNKLKK